MAGDYFLYRYKIVDYRYRLGGKMSISINHNCDPISQQGGTT
jgi:hypothetical protein